MKATRRRRHLATALAAALLAAPAWAGDDGAIEINAVRAAAGGVNGSLVDDPPGFPVRITRAGSYRVTSNLDGGGTSEPLILVQTADVEIDLNGFVLSNGAGRGIDSDADRVAVFGGSVAGVYLTGIYLAGSGARVQAVRSIGNSVGVLVGEGGSVLDSIAIGNRAYGIRADAGIVRGCVVAGNGTTSFPGISAGVIGSPPGVVVSENVALANPIGIQVLDGSVVENLMVGNAGVGLSIFPTSGSATGFAGNAISGNSGGTWSGPGVATGPNTCTGGVPC